MTITVGCGWIVLRGTGSTSLLLMVYAGGMFLYGIIIAWSVATGTWLGPEGGKGSRQVEPRHHCPDF